MSICQDKMVEERSSNSADCNRGYGDKLYSYENEPRSGQIEIACEVAQNNQCPKNNQSIGPFARVFLKRSLVQFDLCAIALSLIIFGGGLFAFIEKRQCESFIGATIFSVLLFISALVEAGNR